jgi:pimeloyl-ACP methyl ester carboxylesterase
MIYQRCRRRAIDISISPLPHAGHFVALEQAEAVNELIARHFAAVEGS